MFNWLGRIFAQYFNDLFSHYDRWDVILGLVLLAALTAWEIAGAADGKLLTFTAWIKSWMPIPIRTGLWLWLGWHFILSDILAGKRH